MSHIARLFVDQPLSDAHTLTPPIEQSRYLLRVMRLQTGAIVRVFNGKDGEWQCELEAAGKSAILHPKRQIRDQFDAADLTLLFAPIKKARTDFIVEKATELGVSALQPVLTEYTQTNRVRTDRMLSLAIEAAEQTERMDLPHIHEATSLRAALSEWDRVKPLIFCDEGGEARLMSEFAPDLAASGGGLLVGPEGGFSLRERETLRSLPFVKPITLGPRILRAETAVVSALTLWQSLVGDWQKAPYVPET